MGTSEKERVCGVNLQKLFKVQAELDKKIVKEKGLEGQDLLDKKILALQVELGELAQNWRGFKYWSEDQEPRVFVPNPDDTCKECNGSPIDTSETEITWMCQACDGVGVHFHNPLLEEYVDCLHFIISIGLELGISNFNFIDEDLPKELKNTTYHFNQIFLSIADVRVNIKLKRLAGIADEYCNMFNLFLLLSKPLGFTWKQIEQAYYEKNKINHERQENGY